MMRFPVSTFSSAGISRRGRFEPADRQSVAGERAVETYMGAVDTEDCRSMPLRSLDLGVIWRKLEKVWRRWRKERMENAVART